MKKLLEILAVLAGALAVSLFVTWPLARELSGQIFGLGGDSFGGMAGFRLWADEIGYRITGVSHIDSWGAPFGFDQGNGVNVQSSFAFLPAYVVTELANEVLAYNLVILTGLTFSGAAMYLLVRRLGCHPAVGAWAGLVYIVFPWHLEKAQGHPSLTHLEGFPLLLLALLAWHARPDVRRALLVAGAVAILWTTSGYFGLMALVALPLPLGLAAIAHARGRGWDVAIKRLALAGGGTLLVSGVIYVLASSGAGEDGIAPARTVGELGVYGARWWEYVLPSLHNPRLGDDVDQWLIPRMHGSNLSETSLYLGWLTIGLALGYIAWAFVKRSSLGPRLRFATLTFAVTAVTGIVFSLPSPLAGDIPSPVRLIWEVAPQFRVPSRFVVLTMAGLVPLAALALDGICRAIADRLSPRRVGQLAATAVCVIAAVLSFLELSISPPAQISELNATQAEYASVRSGGPGLLAEYPLASTEQGITSDYLFYRRAHDRRLVNGAPPGTFSDTIRQTLVDPATPGTAAGLAALGVSDIIVRPNMYAFTGGPPTPPTDLGKGYRRLAETPSGNTVWRVTADPAPAITGFGAGFYAAETPTAGSTMRWMGTKGTVEFYVRRPGSYNATFTVGAYGRARFLDAEGQNGSRSLFVLPNQRTKALVLQLPRGRSRITITAAPQAEALPDGRQATVYMSNWRLDPVRTPRAEPPLASSRVAS